MTNEPNSKNTSQTNNKKGKNSKKIKDETVEALKLGLKSSPHDQHTLLAKYAELFEENRNLKASIQAFEKSGIQAQKEKDKLELEVNKGHLTRSRLESICRELQKQNKTIKEESLVQLKDEEKRRKVASEQFTTTLSEISNLMEENSQSNTKLHSENQRMAVRLQELVAQHEKREDHVEKVLKQRELETQLAEAKLTKLQFEVRQQKETMLIDRKALLEDLSDLQTKLQEKAMTEITLRTQLNSYSKKFEDFEGMVDQSKSVFNGFKKEIETMSKTIKVLEKDRKLWRERCEANDNALNRMAAERLQRDATGDSQAKQNTQLQNLCRAMQQQIKELREQCRLQEELNETLIPKTEDVPSPIENDVSTSTDATDAPVSTTTTEDSSSSEPTKPDEQTIEEVSEVNKSNCIKMNSSVLKTANGPAVNGNAHVEAEKIEILEKNTYMNGSQSNEAIDMEAVD